MNTKNFLKKSSFHLTTFIILLLLGIQFNMHRADAATAGIYSLSDNGTYSKYDITCDGKKDTLTIKTNYSGGIIQSIKIQINNTTAFKKVYGADEFGNSSINYQIIRLKNGKCFLFIRDYGASENYNFNVVYKYSKGKLFPLVTNDMIANSKYNNACTFAPSYADGNNVELEFQMANHRLGAMHLYILYEYEKGALVRASDYAKDFTFLQYNADDKAHNSKFTLNRSCKIYTTSKCKTESFSMKKGEKIKLNKLIVKNGKFYMKVQKVSNGKTGWIKCNNKDFYHKTGPLFKECHYAG